MGTSRLIQWAVAAVFVSMILMEMVVVVSAYEGGVERFTMKNRFNQNRELNKNRNAGQGMGRKKMRKGNNRRKKMDDTIRLQYLEDNIPFEQRRNPEENAAVAKTEDLCCPVEVETFAPVSGRNQKGEFVHLYRDEKIVQHFTEVSCAPQVKDKHCEFLDKKYTNLSKCVQQYSHTYALVVPKEGESRDGRIHSMLEKIEVRSGCACEITKSNRLKKNHNQKSKTRPRRQQDG